MRLGLHRILVSLALVAAAAAGPRIARAQAVGTVCKDGTTSTAKGRGACGKHGGVDPAATKAARDAARPAKPATKKVERVVTCADGTTATSGRGACSHHGGVQGAASTKEDAKDEKRSDADASTREEAHARQRATVETRGSTSARASGALGGREDNDPAGAIAQCTDGLYSHAANRRGACSRHGGVKQWLHS